eukprot:15436743-Alexandrium_andersonii.AAC.1
MRLDCAKSAGEATSSKCTNSAPSAVRSTDCNCSRVNVRGAISVVCMLANRSSRLTARLRAPDWTLASRTWCTVTGKAPSGKGCENEAPSAVDPYTDLGGM